MALHGVLTCALPADLPFSLARFWKGENEQLL